MRKFFVMFVFFAALMAVPVFADDGIGVAIDGEPVVFADQRPALVDGRTLVPVRGVFEHLGFEVDWDNDTRSAILVREGFEIIITMDSDVFTTNGVRHELEVPAQSIGGRTMLPIRAVLESVGYTLGWDNATRTVLVSTDGAETPPEAGRFERVIDRALRFRTAHVHMRLPPEWEVFPRAGMITGTGIPFAATAYDISITSPDAETFGYVTVGVTEGARTLTDEEFLYFHTMRADLTIPDMMDFTLTMLSLENGTGIISSAVSNEELVGEPLPPDAYAYTIFLYAHWDNGVLLFATLHTDNIESANLFATQLLETEVNTAPEEWQFDGTIQFVSAQVRIDLPLDWEVVRRRGTLIPFAEREYDFTLTSPDGVSAAIVTVARTFRGRAFLPEEFSELYTGRVDSTLRHAVEDEIIFTPVALENGVAVFSNVLTDSRLVGRDAPTPGDYMYLVLFYAHWDNGAIAFATLLTDDYENAHFLAMQLSLSLMEITFE